MLAMEKVLITGSGGVVGRALAGKLPYAVTQYDLPQHDVSNYDQLLEAATGHDAIVHLAWNKTRDDWLAEDFDPRNIAMTRTMLEAAAHASVKRVIIASSVHADKFFNRAIHGLLKPYALPVPDSPYGASKCMIEALGRYYADAKELEVICIRFGGVNPTDQPPEQPESERQVWLSHRDTIDLIAKCLAAKEVPGKYAIINAVSANKDRLHDISNPFGWTPQDGAA